MKLRAVAAASLFVFGASGFAACTGEDTGPPAEERTGEAEQELTVCAPPNAVRGIDVSYYQGTIDWNAVAGAGWRFAIARINHGDFMDPEFDANWAGIKNAGMIRGAYQYFSPAMDIPTQAQIVIDKVGKLGPGDLPVVIDVEETEGVAPAGMESRIAEWVDLVEAGTGKKPMIYTGKYFWQDNVGSSAFSDYPLWHAQYPNACLPPNPPPPDCGCANIADQWSTWTVWQYGFVGAIPGIGGDVDKNVFMGTEDELVAFANQGGYGAEVVSIEAPTTVLAGESFAVRITVTNTGSMAWDASTRLGTTEPRDRTSPFHDASWLTENRAAAVDGTVDLGQDYTFEITLHAPSEVGAYVEHFGLVQESVTWFADQGGPADADVALGLQVIDGSVSNGVGGGGSGTGGSGAGGGDADGDLSEPTCECTVPGAPASPVGRGAACAAFGLAVASLRHRRRPGRPG